MAAGDEFPLEVILIIVAVIVVLFIAIFFGGRFISARLRKRKVFTDPSKPAKSAVGVGERYDGAGDNGGGASKDDVKLDLNKFIEINVSNMQLTDIINSQLSYINSLNMKEFEKIRKTNFNKLFKVPISTAKLLHTDPNDADATNITKTRMQEIETNISAIFSSKVDTDTLSTDIVNSILSYNVNIPAINQTLYMSTYNFIINRIKDRLDKYTKAGDVNNLNKFVNSIRAVINTNMTDTLIKSTFLDTNNKQDLLIRHLIWNSITENDTSSADKFQYKLTDFVNKSNPDNSEDYILTYFNAAQFIGDLTKYAKHIIKLNNIDNLGKMNNIIYKRRSSIDALVASLGTLDISSYTDINKKNTEFSNAFKGLKFDIGKTQPDKTQKYITKERDGINSHNNQINDIFTNFIHPIGAIIKFNNTKSTDHAKLDTELNLLKKDRLSLINNAFNAHSDNELFKILKTYADSKIAEYDTIVNRLKNQKQLESDLKQIIKNADVILTNATDNYTAGDAIVKNIEVKNGVNLDTQLEEFKESVYNQLGFAANIDTKKSEFESKTGGASTSQISDFEKKYNSVHDQTSKFIDLLKRVHKVTKHYHGEYSKIMMELKTGLNTLKLSELTDKSSDIDIQYRLATKLSEASADVSEKLELHTHNITSNEGKLHKEITDINTEITTTHKDTKDDLNKAITDRAQDKVTQAVADVTARVGTMRTEITRITGVKDTIKSDINEKIMKDGIATADALLQTDKTITEIADLHTAITALKPIPATEFTDLISDAASVDSPVITTELEDKIKEYNDLIPTVENFATECTNKILTDAVAKANALATQCVTDLGNVTPIGTDPVQYALDVVRVKLVYTDIAKYVEIVGKITNKKGTDYDKIIKSQGGLVVSIGRFELDLISHVQKLKQTISDNITQSSTISNGINSGSAPAYVQAAIKQLADIQTQNSDNFKIIRDIGSNPSIVSLLTPGIISKKYMIDTPKNMKKVDEALVKSEKLEEEVKITSAAKAAATAYASAAAAAATSITAAADTVTLKTAADGVKEAITEIKTGYESEYDLKAAAVKKAARADVKTITDKLPNFKTYIDNTETYLRTIKDNIVVVPDAHPTPNINDDEITSLNAKVKIVEDELAAIKPLYGDLNTWNTLDATTGSTHADAAIDAVITANVQTSFTDAIQNADAICDAIIAVIASGTIASVADIATKTAELDNIIKDTIPKTILPAKATVIGALNTTVSATIKTTVIDPNTAKVATIDSEIAKKSINTVITDALAASKKLVDAITSDKAAIETIITNNIDKLPNLIAIADDQQLIVSNIDKGDILTDPTTKKYTQEKINAIEAYSMIRGPTGSREIVDKIPQHVKTIKDNLATVTTANNAIDTADTIARDGTKSLTEKIDGMVRIYTEYNKVKTLKSICDTNNAEIKNLKGTLDVLVKVIKLSDTIVKDNIAVFNINENAKTKVTTAHDILSDNQIIDRDAGINFADMQTKVNRIIAKVSSIQNPGIVQAVASINTELARLQRKTTDINDKLIELNAEYTVNILNKQNDISTHLNYFKDNTQNFGKNLTFWNNEINTRTGANTAIKNLSSGYVTQCKNINNKIKYDVINRKSTEIGDLVRDFNRVKIKVNAALKQAITVYQLIIMDDDDDDAPSITQQQDDDKVKPFSQNSYDILPLDPKVATLSSNMQFSESKSTATNNPGNSFMYTIVPYDSQELSSDDRVLEIVSFARTQRMPLKDAANIIVKAGELLKKYRGTKKVIPGAWVYRGGKLFSSVKPTKIEELERYIELMRRSLAISDGLDRGSRSGGGANTKR
jgi:hypothetical protein